MISPFSILENASLLFTLSLSVAEDPNTGNEIPSNPSTLRVSAYFKKVSPIIREAKGSDFSEFAVEGYAIDPNPLPVWCKNSKGKVPCWINGVGQGFFRWQPRLLVAKELVESVTGTTLQGTFVLEGGFNESHSEL